MISYDPIEVNGMQYLMEDKKSINKLKEQELEKRKIATETLKTNRQKEVEKKKKNLKIAVRCSIGFLILAGSLLKIERHFNPTNIYQKNKLVLSEDKEDELYEKISHEAGMDIEENERILVLNAVIENKKLTDEEKHVLYEFHDLLLENPYLNKELAYKSLKKVGVVENVKENPDVQGKYNLPLKLVEIFLEKNDSDYESTLIHEFIHCIYFTEETYKLPKYFREGMTQLLTREYFTSSPYYEPDSYPIETIAVKQLCNMIGSNKVLEAFSKGDMSIISEELSRTMPEKESQQFLEDMETSFDHYEKNYSIADKDYFIGMRNFLLNFDKKRYADSLENDTYEELWEEKLEESNYNLEILKLIAKEYPYDEYLYFIEENGVYLTPYFSEKLKDNFDETQKKGYVINK